jgi:2-octaprenyl-6-methoxyphenol hydroxylase
MPLKECSSLQHFDLIIAGGGSIGSTLALALNKVSGLKIAIIEAQAVPDIEDSTHSHPGFDARVVALAKHSADLLQTFGLNELAKISTAIKHIHVSDKGHIGQCQLHSSDYQIPALGHVVQLQQLGQALNSALGRGNSDTLQWFCPDQVNGVRQHQDYIDLQLASGEALRAKLLVVAEGGNSPTRGLLNIATNTLPYEQSALIANVMTDKRHQYWAYERFTEHGPLAVLPLANTWQNNGSGSCSSIVWTMTGEKLQAMMGASDEVFMAQLQQDFGYRLGNFIAVGQRYAYPLQLVKSCSSISHRAVVIGNAAQSLHPIAGQGLNLGLRDVEALCHCIQGAIAQGADIGEHRTLRTYEKLRADDQRNTISLTDGLVRVFSNNYGSLIAGRNLGLVAMNLLSPLKAKLAQQAMGLLKISEQDKLEIN